MLRAYQQDVIGRCIAAWGTGLRNLMPVCPTGSGKTKIMAYVASNHKEPGVAIAHRSVLIGQISLALAAEGVVHDIIAPKSVVRTIVNAHMEELGRNYYNPSAQWKVASVDTLPGRIDRLSSWARRVTLGFTDESHHILATNKWGKACFMFPNARWLLPTATPLRGDRRGLGRDADGIADAIIEGPSPRWLIDNGYLTDYVIRAPLPADLNLDDVQIGSNGEYNQVQVRRAVHRSAKIVGNVVDTYLANTPGKLGIVFAVDIEHAKMLTAEFIAKGIAAELITADSPEEERREVLKRYRSRSTLVLVNVDLFGEGFDLPAIEVVMMARPTASYGLYAQQFGRALRILVNKSYMDNWEGYTAEQRLAIIAQSEKPVAYIHDHVGNVLHFFGPPTKQCHWSLDASPGRRAGPSDAIPLRVCTNTLCQQPFERFYPACPYCGTPVPAPAGLALPEQVDGDITLYTPEMLRKIFGVDSVQAALEKAPSTFCAIPPGMPLPTVRALQRTHQEKLAQQAKLAQLMALVMPPTRNARENMRLFYLRYGVDIVSARLLGAKDTEGLNQKVYDSIVSS